MSKGAEPETAVLTEAQTRDALLERVSGVCDTDIVVADVMRLSGWTESDVRRLINDMGDDGELIGIDRSISRPLVRCEDPPKYVVGDEDDGEIPEPGVGRPKTDPVFAQWVVSDGVVALDADSEQDARRIAEGRAFGGHESAVYRRVAVCRLRPEWDDATE